MDGDAWVELDVARELASTIETAKLFLYSGSQHLFADNSLAHYDQQAAAQLMKRVLAFLKDIEWTTAVGRGTFANAGPTDG
jgi:dienelactone hydrolase